MARGDDAFRWYNVGEWAPYGLAVPNFGNDGKSQNSTVRDLVQTIGRNLAAVMWHTDAMLRTPPSINTITRIHKLCTRVRSILASRAVPSGTLNMESAHAIPAWEEFLVYPTPYFKVRNSWMKDFCGLTLIALTEATQHSENAKALEISTDFSGLIGQYFRRIYSRMAVELLRVPAAEAGAMDFTLTDAQLAAYNPSSYFTSTELIDTVPSEWSRPTEDDLECLTDGIATSQLPILPRWPSSPPSGSGSAGLSGVATARGESFAAAPGA